MRFNADKRKAVLTLLLDEEWGKWSDSEIAKRCAVTHTFAGTVRSSLATVASDASRTYRTKHGTVATMRTHCATRPFYTSFSWRNGRNNRSQPATGCCIPACARRASVSNWSPPRRRWTTGASEWLSDHRHRGGPQRGVYAILERGELAERGRPQKTSHGGIFSTLADIGLTLSQSSRYQAGERDRLLAATRNGNAGWLGPACRPPSLGQGNPAANKYGTWTG